MPRSGSRARDVFPDAADAPTRVSLPNIYTAARNQPRNYHASETRRSLARAPRVVASKVAARGNPRRRPRQRQSCDAPAAALAPIRGLLAAIVGTALAFPHLREAALLPPPLIVLAKVVPIGLALLLVHALGAGSPIVSELTAALLWSTGGDVGLELESLTGQKAYFLAGLGCFMVAHLVISPPSPRRRATSPLKAAPAGTLLLLLYAAYFYSVLAGGNLPPLMARPVLAYALSIGVMGAFAIARKPAASLSRTACALGALSFVVSDSVIGYNRFVAPVPHAELLISTTYYAGQLGLAFAAYTPAARKA